MSKKDTTVESSLFSDKLVETTTTPPVPEENKLEPADWIVVVDDSPSNLTIICGVLNKLGFGTISFRDGQLALDGIAALPQMRRDRVRAIFSDLMMPKMDGLSFLREVRKSEQGSHMPFVVVTSSTERANITEALSLKISGYLLKPITAKSITDTITHLFPNHIQPKAEEKVSIRRV